MCMYIFYILYILYIYIIMYIHYFIDIIYLIYICTLYHMYIYILYHMCVCIYIYYIIYIYIHIEKFKVATLLSLSVAAVAVRAFCTVGQKLQAQGLLIQDVDSNIHHLLNCTHTCCVGQCCYSTRSLNLLELPTHCRKQTMLKCNHIMLILWH